MIPLYFAAIMRYGKPLFVAGVVVHLLLCVLALVYFRQRLVLPDDANYLFELLSNDGGFAIFHNRFIAVPAQVLPWLAIRCGASLNTVALLYSLNLELFMFAVYLICGLLLRNYRMALGCLLAQLLITTDTFFWTVSELPFCLALLFPLAALLERRTAGAGSLPAIAGLLITIAFGHSLALFGVGFCIANLWLRLPERRRRLGMAVSIYGAALVIKMIFFRDPYDRGALGGLRNVQRLFPDYFSTPAFREFLQSCAGDFVWLPICVACIAAWYLVRKEYRFAGLFILASGGYLALVMICFPQEDPTRFYHENLLQPLAFLTAFAFVADVTGNLRREWIGTLFFAAIVAHALIRICNTAGRYAQRLAWQRSLIDRYRGQKVILPESRFQPQQYLLSWSSPYEFWLLSSLDTGNAASIMITKDPAGAKRRVGDDTRAFLPAFGVYRYETLPGRYFPFHDSTQVYRIED